MAEYAVLAQMISAPNYINRGYSDRRGYLFTPQQDLNVISLGGYFEDMQTVELWDSAGMIASATAGNVGGPYGWHYAPIAPVRVLAGEQYAVVVACDGGTDYGYQSSWSAGTVGGVRVDRAVYYFASMSSFSSTTLRQYGLADIKVSDRMDWVHQTADAVGLVDGLTGSAHGAKRSSSELIYLADHLVRATIPDHGWGIEKWGEAAWGVVLRKQSAADTIGVADAVTRKVKRSEGDDISLADELRATAKLQAAEALAITEAVSKVIRALLADTVGIGETITQKNALSYLLEDTAGVGDALVQIRADLVRQLPGENVPVAESLTAAQEFARGLSDLLVISEHLANLARKQAGDVADVADMLAASIGSKAADALTLDDAAVILAGKSAGDMVAATDGLAAKIKALQADQVSVGDALVQTVMRKLVEEILELADQGQAAVAKALSDVLSLSNDQLQQMAVQLAKSSDLALADWMASEAGKGMDEQATVSDNLVAALHMVREVQDLLSVSDQVRAMVRLVLDDVLTVTDDIHADMEAARSEALAIAEILGLAVGKQLPVDAVGVIDEMALRAALGLGTDRALISDQIAIRRVRMLQQVFINGVQVPVAGLRVHHSASERVSTCSFSIPNPSSQVLSLARQRAEVRVYLLDGDGTDYFAGRIVGNPVRARGSVSTELQITADDWTAAAQDIYVSEVYTSDDGTLDQLVKDLWSRYFEQPINLSQVVSTSKTVDMIAFNYDTLFDATEKIAQLLGWVWFVEWDGTNLVLRFFPPSAAVQPVTLSHENRNVEASTARFGQSDKLVNSVYVFGGEGKSAAFTERILADGERAIYRLSYRPQRPVDGSSGVQVTVAGALQTIGIYGIHDASAFDLLLDFNQQQLIWRGSNKPAKDAVIEAVYSYGYPILVHLSDDQSIAAFGKSEAILTDSKIRDITTARELGRATLRNSAWPQGYGSCEVFVPGLRAGQFVTVDLPAYSAQGLFEILEIEKWIQAGTVRRRITLNMADAAEARIAERLRVFAQRIASLEAAQRADDPVVQRILSDTANLRVTVTGRAAGQIHDSVESAVSALDAAVIACIGSGSSKVYADDFVRVLDAGAARIGPQNNSIGQVAEYVRGGISFWGRTKWGEKPWGIGVKG